MCIHVFFIKTHMRVKINNLTDTEKTELLAEVNKRERRQEESKPDWLLQLQREHLWQMWWLQTQ